MPGRTVTTVFRHTRRRGCRISAAALSLTVVAACSGGGGPQAHAPTTTKATGSTRPVATTTSTPLDQAALARRQALAAYEAMWRDMTVAARTADYTSALLPQHASGAALATLVHGLYTEQRLGFVSKGSPSIDPAVTGVSPPPNPTSVTIRDCFDDTHWLNYKPDGTPQDNKPGGRHRTAATVTVDAGVWKVTQLSVGALGTC